MNNIFVWTVGDVIGLITIFVFVVIYAFIAVINWIDRLRCKHDGGYNETSACDAICKKCGKNLGFIGKIRDRS